MTVLVSAINYAPTTIVQDGPHKIWTRYVIKIPKNQVVSGTASGHRWAGPFDYPAEGIGTAQMFLSVSQGTGWAAFPVTWLTESGYSVYGSFDEPSTTPTDRMWLAVRGDYASGTAGLNNILGGDLGGVTAKGHITITTPARSYIVKVSSATTVSGELVITVLGIKSN